ncbi:hypothetical protein HK105_209129 [Polyrhizophydium stewartii]|uniref:Uncharacterized protein n=1 Tax=Polyrhizophydium stewartii TaxID=2732419 RepID=A0ABR4MVY5_9FUNG
MPPVAHVAAAVAVSAGDAHLPLSAEPVVAAGAALAFLALAAALGSMIFFVRRGLTQGFTPAVMALVAVNAFALVLQLFEILHVHISPPAQGLFVLRNIWFALSILGLNLLQIEVAAVFQGSLIRLSWLDRRGLARPRIYSNYGIGVYSFIVALCGVGLNIFILLCVRQNVAQRVYRGGKTPTLDTSRADRARAVQVLVLFVLAFELAAFCSFVSSMFFTEDGDGRLLYFGLIEISLALFGLHMTVETIMFEQVVMIFRNGAPKQREQGSGSTDGGEQPEQDAAVAIEDMHETAGERRRRDTLTLIEALAMRSPPPVVGAGAAGPSVAPSAAAAPGNVVRIELPQDAERGTEAPLPPLPPESKLPPKISLATIGSHDDSTRASLAPGSRSSMLKHSSIGSDIASLWNAAWPWASRNSGILSSPAPTSPVAGTAGSAGPSNGGLHVPGTTKE